MSSITPYQHQISIAKTAYDILCQHMLVYLAMEERTGKTLTSILIAETCETINDVLIITKKKALDGWEQTLKAYPTKKNYTLVNYHMAQRIKYSPNRLIILDEAHAYLSVYPKTGVIWKQVAKLTSDCPIIYLSATPSAQSYSLLYHQFKLSSFSPFIKYANFYKWFAKFGLSKSKYIGGGRKVLDYSSTREDEVLKACGHLFISFTRKELDFKHEPEDILHYVSLSPETKYLYKQIQDKGVANINGEDIIADTPAAVLTKLHQIEGGTIKELGDIGNTEKIDYILKNFGDTQDVVIFYHYQQELVKLSKHFTQAKLLQATSYAEGVDLSGYNTLIIYSMDFSTARYTQRRARQANIKRETPINVHFILVKGYISDQVYQCVAVNKVNFVDKYYERTSDTDSNN